MHWFVDFLYATLFVIILQKNLWVHHPQCWLFGSDESVYLTTKECINLRLDMCFWFTSSQYSRLLVYWSHATTAHFSRLTPGFGSKMSGTAITANETLGGWLSESKALTPSGLFGSFFSMTGAFGRSPTSGAIYGKHLKRPGWVFKRLEPNRAHQDPDRSWDTLFASSMLLRLTSMSCNCLESDVLPVQSDNLCRFVAEKVNRFARFRPRDVNVRQLWILN